MNRASLDEQERLLTLWYTEWARDRLAEAAGTVIDRFRTYELLLTPLEQVSEPPDEHPEGDVLYHSLQVFELARQWRPYDEEFLTAALLHDVGKAIDRRNHVAAGLEALAGAVSPRTAWLIEHHVEAFSMLAGAIGADAPPARGFRELRGTDALGRLRSAGPRRRRKNLRCHRGDRLSPRPFGGGRRVRGLRGYPRKDGNPSPLTLGEG